MPDSSWMKALVQVQTILTDTATLIARETGKEDAPDLLLAEAKALDDVEAIISSHCKRLSSEFRRQHNSSQAVNRLPFELLTAMFEMCLSLEKGTGGRQDAKQLHRICSVCYLWKEITEGSPQLWCYVTGLDPLQHIQKALKLSEPLPITVAYPSFDPLMSELEFAEAVNPHVARWGRIKINYLNVCQHSKAWEQAALPKVTHFEITSVYGADRPLLRLAGGRSLRNLQVLDLRNIPFRWDELRLQLPNLRVLTLEVYDDDHKSPTALQLLRFLQNTPGLQVLSLSNVLLPADDSDRVLVTLTRLHSLTLVEVELDGFQQLLSSLQLSPAAVSEPSLNMTSRSVEGNYRWGEYEDSVKLFERRVEFHVRGFNLELRTSSRPTGIELWQLVFRTFGERLAGIPKLQVHTALLGHSSTNIRSLISLLELLPGLRAVTLTQSSTLARNSLFNLFSTTKTFLNQICQSDGASWRLPQLESITLHLAVSSYREVEALLRDAEEVVDANGGQMANRELQINLMKGGSDPQKCGFRMADLQEALKQFLDAGTLIAQVYYIDSSDSEEE